MKASDGGVESTKLFTLVAMTPSKRSLAMVYNTKCNEKVTHNDKVTGKRSPDDGRGGGSSAAAPQKKSKK